MNYMTMAVVAENGRRVASVVKVAGSIPDCQGVVKIESDPKTAPQASVGKGT